MSSGDRTRKPNLVGRVAVRRRGADAMPVSALAELIEAQRAELGRSFEAIADRAKAAGFPISKSYVHQLASEPIEDVPSTSVLKALSYGLTIPLPVVVDAALESCGLRRSRSPHSRWVTITARKEELSETAQDALEEQVESLFRLYETNTDR